MFAALNVHPTPLLSSIQALADAHIFTFTLVMRQGRPCAPNYSKVRLDISSRFLTPISSLPFEADMFSQPGVILPQPSHLHFKLAVKVYSFDPRCEPVTTLHTLHINEVIFGFRYELEDPQERCVALLKILVKRNEEAWRRAVHNPCGCHADLSV